MINILPNLRARFRRAERDSMLTNLQEAAAKDPVDAESFYRAYRQIEANKFYFSSDQIDEVNALMDSHWERRIAAGGKIRVFAPPLRPDPDMHDGYLID